MVAPTKESTEDFASEFLNVMGRIRRLRKYLRGCDSATLIAMRDRLNELIGERESEEIAELEAAEAKLRSIAEVKQLMEERGLSDDDLLTTEALQEATAKEAKKVRKPKYLYIDDDNNEFRWNGKGKTPKKFAELIASGVDIDKDCLARKIEG